MEIKKTEVIYVDKESGFVLKKTTTDEGEFYNRQLTVPNTIYVCEKKRVNLNKPILNAHFQTHHLKWDKSNEEWELTGLKKSRKHAENNYRFFMPFHQRNQQQWENLTWGESLDELQDLLRKTKIVPINIPINSTLEEWESNKIKALSYLDEDQILMPIISSKHSPKTFPLIFNKELRESLFLGVSCFELVDAVEKINLNFVKAINSRLNEGEECALITYFNYPRVMSRHLQVAGSFAFSCFGGDVLSQRANFYIDFEKVDSLTPDDIYCYDNREKKFTKSKSQKERYGFDLSNNLTNIIPIAEGLDFHQAIKFLCHKLQQEDLNQINKFLIEKQPLTQKLMDYTGWGVFLETTNSPQN